MREPRETMDSYTLAIIGLLALIILAIIMIVILVRGTGNDDGPVVREPPATTPAGESPDGSPLPEADAQIEMIPSIQFDKNELTVSEGEVTVLADNNDGSILHNWAVYESESAADEGEEAIAATELCAAPCTETVTFDAPPPGTYFFRCDVHPTQMTGDFVVQ